MKDYSPKNGNNQEEHEESLLNGIENINRLEEWAKHGARIILSLAIKNEIDEYKEKTKPLRDEEGRRLVYRNGYHREREIKAFILFLYLKWVSTGNFYFNTFEDKNPKTVMCLTKNEEELLTFYDFPAPHFQQIRTANPIESRFTDRKTTLAMTFKFSHLVEKKWRKLRGFEEISFVLRGKPCHNDSRKENVIA